MVDNSRQQDPVVDEESFEALRLYHDAAMQIQSLKEGNQERHNVRFIGALKDKSILVTLPLIDGERLWMQSGQSYVVRGFTGKYAYALIVQVIRARTHPYPYVHFSYPRFVQSRAVRKSLRVKLDLQATITLDDNGKSMPATMADLSTTGSMMNLPAPIGEIGGTVKLNFPVNIDDIKADLNLSAKIKNISEPKEGENVSIGVEFENMDQNQKLILHYFTHSIARDSVQ